MTVLILIALGGGIAFSVLAAVGILRMPDVYTRMQASSKAGTLGCALVLGAVAMAYGEPAVTTRAVLVIAFVLLTAPVAAHVVGRVAHRAGARMTADDALDELRDARRDDPRSFSPPASSNRSAEP